MADVAADGWAPQGAPAAATDPQRHFPVTVRAIWTYT